MRQKTHWQNEKPGCCGILKKPAITATGAQDSSDEPGWEEARK
jgi:hypothetical protein